MFCGILNWHSNRTRSHNYGLAVKEVLALVAFVAGLARSAPAQKVSSNNVFVGYSFAGANLFSGQHANLNGWNFSAEKKYLPFFGIVADVSGHYGSKELRDSTCASTSGCVTSNMVSEHYFQFGIRGSYTSKWVRPFIELLFGAVHAAESGNGMSNSNTSFEETLGVGVDYRIARRFGWRIDADWAGTPHSITRQNSVRASTGLVICF